MRHPLLRRHPVLRALTSLWLAAGLIFLLAPPSPVGAAEASSPAETSVPNGAAGVGGLRFSLVFYWLSGEGPQVRVSTIVQAEGASAAAPLTLALSTGGSWTPESVKVTGVPRVTPEAGDAAAGAVSAPATARRLEPPLVLHLPAGFSRAVVSVDGCLSPSVYQRLISGADPVGFRLADFAFQPSPPAPSWSLSVLLPEGYRAILPDGRELAMGAWALAASDHPGAPPADWTVSKGGSAPPNEPSEASPPDAHDSQTPEAEIPVPPDLAGPAIVIDGAPIALESPPPRSGGRLLLPLRAVAEALGAQVEWRGLERKARVTMGQWTGEAKAGSYLARLPGGYALLPDAPTLADGRLWVPPELVAALFGLESQVDAARGIAVFRRRGPAEVPPPAAGADQFSPATGLRQTETGGAGAKVGTVYLTMDDGPSLLTPRFLDVLAARRVQVTFFVVGTRALSFPGTLRRAAREGHEIGNHTYDHDYAHIYTERIGDFWDSVMRAEGIIRANTGSRTYAVRAPGGRLLAPELRDALRAAGYRVVGWDCSAADTAVPAPDAWTIFDNVVSGVEARTRLGEKETIVLMHDAAGHERTLEAFPFILDHLVAKGYVLTVLDPAAQAAEMPAAGP